MKIEVDAGVASGRISPLRMAQVSQSGRRVSVPVKPSQAVFAQFRHISGTPASAGESTVPISRLRLFNRIVSILRARQEGLPGNSELPDSHGIKEYDAKLSQVTAGLVFNFGA